MTEVVSHQISLNVNGRQVKMNVESRATLAETLRQDCGLTGTKLGCEQGSCGACTVVFDLKQIRACLMFAVQAQDAEIWTIEGLCGPVPERLATEEPQATPVPLPRLPALASAMKRNHGLQCGFCTPGMLIAAATLGEQANGNLSEAVIHEGLSGNICRCTGYQGIVQSIVETFNPSGENDAPSDGGEAAV